MGYVSINERSRHEMTTEVQLQNTGRVIGLAQSGCDLSTEFLPNGEVAWNQQHLTPRPGLLNWEVGAKYIEGVSTPERWHKLLQ